MTEWEHTDKETGHTMKPGLGKQSKNNKLN